ncbi:nuclear transport factor 2 family protein [Saccharopolyspora sp. K220]|uniref:nuclear transport factor 2 family protein n=1 Tax=Saccharopolyspora soli TaxID=2926618 RepID=UPI001F58A821|nr:nuclear transport factor 2 family protein [Saccharopolyspora soli]MCI2421883.1 nuclear transport factor 2 family protein [Saccharopolyspora soli]
MPRASKSRHGWRLYELETTFQYTRPNLRDDAQIGQATDLRLIVSGRADADRIAAVFTEDAEWLAPPGNATAVALEAPSHMVGKKAIVRFLAEDFPRLFVADVAVTFHGFHADGEGVIVEETMTATLANGNHYANDYCFVFELQDGLIRQVREYMDTARGQRMIFGDVQQ